MRRLGFVAMVVYSLLGGPTAHAVTCSNDTQCSDGSVCTGTEHCVGGQCQAGSPLNCTDNNICTSDSCDSVFGCQHANVANGSTCGDTDVCNGVEQCVNGACVQSPPPSCDDQSPCTVDSCDSLTGCKHVALTNGTPCGDNEFCNGFEQCQTGVCVPGTPQPNGTNCGDTNVCNGIDQCVSGVCQHSAAPNCEDQNPCTVDSCDTLTGCKHVSLSNGTPCGDNQTCNGVETCQSGACVASNPPPNGTACNDGNRCTSGDHCEGGTCIGGSERPDGSGCGDGNPCNGNELCSNGVCQPGQPKANGTSCSDGNPCNGDEICVTGICTAGTPKPNGALCDDNFVCNGTEVCQDQLCFAGNPPPNGTPCSDGNVCNGAESCQAGICTRGPDPGCEDNNPCTVDTCDKVLGCQHAPKQDGSSCSDGNVCNGAETCTNSVCTAGTPLPNGSLCDDNNLCNGTETCTNSVCTAGTPRPDGTSCGDGNVCNGFEACQAGACKAGTPQNCVDNNPCTSDTCDPISGCFHQILPNGSSCSDNNVCNGSEICVNAQCQGGVALVCTDPFPNTVNSCDALAGCVIDKPIAGGKVNIPRSNPTTWRIKATSGETLFLGGSTAGNTTEGDPVLHGGALHIASGNPSDPYDQHFALPAANWSYIGDPGEDVGYKYKDRSGGEIRMVKVKTGRAWKINGRGPDVGPKLAVDPNPVAVELILGNQRYCMSFGGLTEFAPDKRFKAVDAPAPAFCQ